MIKRHPTRRLAIGGVDIGGDAPVSLQSMTNTDTRDVPATLEQIRSLSRLGCDLVRVAVPDMNSAKALESIVADSPIPVIADIHFDFRLALAAIDAGAAAIRLNPGNLSHEREVRRIAEKAGAARIPIRVGANSGSVRPALIRELRQSGVPSASIMCEALVRSVFEECNRLEKYGFKSIKVSLKSSSVVETIAACRCFSERSDYPQHIGITEAGLPGNGIVKSAVGIGALLMEGIGDTIRVSLTANPIEEVIAGRRILEACSLRKSFPDVVACPTCGRTTINLIGLAKRVEDLIAELKADGMTIGLRKIAVMGCAVNGPGEARDADLGIAGGRGRIILFCRGRIMGIYTSEKEGFEHLKREILNQCFPAST